MTTCPLIRNSYSLLPYAFLQIVPVVLVIPRLVKLPLRYYTLNFNNFFGHLNRPPHSSSDSLYMYSVSHTTYSLLTASETVSIRATTNILRHFDPSHSRDRSNQRNLEPLFLVASTTPIHTI